MKTLSIIFVISLLFILGGCSENSVPVGPQDDIVTLSKVPVPFKGNLDGVAIITMSTECGPLPLTSINGSGNATHLGKYTSLTKACILPDGPDSPNGTFINGVHTAIAANGDELHGTWTGAYQTDLNTGVVSYTLNMTLTGGTGRFIGATGQLVFNATAPYVAPGADKIVTAEGGGWILFQ